jgi:hypothetical protein
MPYIKLENFSGIVPRTGDTQLEPNQAVIARNVRVSSRELRSWKKPVLEYVSPVPNTQTIFKHYKEDTGAFRWLVWDKDVDVVRSPVADDTDFRVYYTGDGEPRKTNWNLATTNGFGTGPFPNDYLSIKVPGPRTAPSLSASGGSGGTETRAYVYTYVSTFGSVAEESQPSPAGNVNCNELGATVTVAGFTTTGTYSQTGTTITVTETSHGLANGDVVYLDFTSGTAVDGQYTVTVTDLNTYTVTGPTATTSGNVTILAKLPSGRYNITHRRIYRTLVGATQVTYQLVEQIPLTTTTYDDTKTAVDLGSVLRTQSWNPPPDGLKGITAMVNGMLAGFVENQVWFCEPYLPHAWPDLYTLVMPSRVVGLGVFDTTLVVLTETEPVLITGSTPLALSQSKLPLFQPCASKRSIASDQYGVMYASPNGLVSIGSSGADVISLPLYTREEWQNIIPATMRSFIYNNQYIGFYSNPFGSRGIVLTRADSPPLVELDFDAAAVFVDKVTSNIFAVSTLDNTIYQLDSDPVNRTFYEWRSKRFIVPAPMSFAALKVRAAFQDIDDIIAYNQARDALKQDNEDLWDALSGQIAGSINETPLNTFELNGSVLTSLPVLGDTRSVNITIFADDEIWYATGVDSLEPIRLPADKKYAVWQIEISGNVPVQTVAIGSSIAELRGLIE